MFQVGHNTVRKQLVYCSNTIQASPPVLDLRIARTAKVYHRGAQLQLEKRERFLFLQYKLNKPFYMTLYGTILKDNHVITSYEIQEKISKLELDTPEKRFPETKGLEIPCEVYRWCSSYERCLKFIDSMDDDIRNLFECREFQIDPSLLGMIVPNKKCQ